MSARSTQVLVAAMALGWAAPRLARAEQVEQERLLQDLAQAFPGGRFTPTVGSWVVYRIGPEPYRFWRIAVLSQQSTPRGEGYWMEVDFGPVPLGGALSLKLLTTGDPREGGTQVLRAYFRLGGGIVQELDAKALARLNQPRAPAPNASFEPTLPAQDYSTKLTHAGSFRSVKLDNGAGTAFWLSPDVPVFHLASVESPGRTMEAFQFGDKALDTMGEPVNKVVVKPEGAPGAAVDGGGP